MTRVWPRPLVVLAWNIHVSRPWQQAADQLRSWLAHHRPDVVVLVECYRVHDDDLAKFAGFLGYELQPRHDDRREAWDVRILVRKGLEVTSRGALVGTYPWVGPDHRLPHHGRVFPWVGLNVGGRPFTVLGVHRISGRRIIRNRSAWREEAKLLRGFADAVPAERVYLEVGDRNEGPITGRLAARRARARYVRGHGVDAALVRGATARARDLGRGGSDHDAILWTVRAAR